MKQDLFPVDESHVAPSVIGDAYHPESDEDGPVLAYVPSQRLNPGDTEVTVEFRWTTDSRLAVLAYSSLESLVECCGGRQPWVSLPVDRVDEIASESQADVVLWDAGLPAEERRDELEVAGE